MKLRKPNQLSEWRKIAIAFALGTLFGIVTIRWLVPALIKLL
jgi:hypothetical protein